MRKKISRRKLLIRASQAIAASAVGFPFLSLGENHATLRDSAGTVVGNPAGAKVGRAVLADGGNAVDAVVAAGLVSGMVDPQYTGAGGYGGHLIFAQARGKKIACIDFNSAAAAAARPDMFPCDDKGEVKGAINRYGWLASGVPGILAGLELALQRHGTRSFAELVQPAMRMARDGVPMSGICAKAIAESAARLGADPGSAKLYLTSGKFPKAGDILRNPELADMFSTLADRNSVDSFYRGDIAHHIADAFQEHGGIVTAKDLAVYRAREVKPVEIKYGDFTIYAAPVTAGGLTALQGLSVLDALHWDAQPPSLAATHALLETLRLVWKDRLELLGDPDQVQVPVHRLLSTRYAKELASRANEAARSGKPLDLKIRSTPGPGTVNISSVDRHGNVAAMTITHGAEFGSQVTVDGLGLTLGHGMAKFDPEPASANSPGPGKRPLEPV